MDRKQIDIAFGDTATVLSLKSLNRLNEERINNSKKEYDDYFSNDSLFSGNNGEFPNLIHINFKNTLQRIKGGLSFLEEQEIPEKKAKTEVYDQTEISEKNPYNFLSKSSMDMYKKSIVEIPNYTSSKFDNYSVGVEFLNKNKKEEIEESIRFFLEKMDFLHGFRFIYSSQQGWGPFV